MDDLFDEADQLLFNKRKYDDAMALYQRILELDPCNIDAFNSVAYCISLTRGHSATCSTRSDVSFGEG
jgi:tetratricopeptide (TPR) repeat protein